MATANSNAQEYYAKQAAFQKACNAATAEQQKYCKHPRTIVHAFPGKQVWKRCLACGDTDKDGKWLTCSKCTARVYETYAGELCSKCSVEEKQMLSKKKLPKYNGQAIVDKVIGYKVVLPTEHKKGSWWALPKANSPMWTEQWGFQGSGKAPYIITRYKNKNDGATTNEGWACSCPAFTQNTPRVPCKHILAIMKCIGFESMWLKAGGSAKIAVATKDDAEAEAFEQWKRDRAAAKAETSAVVGDKKLKMFGDQGRKFR